MNTPFHTCREGKGKKQKQQKKIPNTQTPHTSPIPHLQKTKQNKTHTTKPLAKKTPNILYKEAGGYQIASV